MNTHYIKIILIGCLIFQLGCSGIKFKRKASASTVSKHEIKGAQAKSSATDDKQDKRKYGTYFSKKDAEIISLFYSNVANALIRKEMIRHTTISRKQEKNLIAGKIIPHELQVVPLPLKLHKQLSSLPLDVLRVQVGTRVILMQVKSRKILDLITI